MTMNNEQGRSLLASKSKRPSRSRKLRPDAAKGDAYHGCAGNASLPDGNARVTIFIITINIIKATDLANHDAGIVRRIARKGDVSDPYCLVSIGGMSSRTHTIQDDLNPVWNETLTFLVAKRPATVLLQVFDEDTHERDDFCGKAEIDVSSLVEDEGSMDSELPLMVENGRQKGSLHVRVSCRTQPPSDPRVEKKLKDKNARLRQKMDEREKELGLENARLRQEMGNENARLRKELDASEARRARLEAEVRGLTQALERREGLEAELRQRQQAVGAFPEGMESRRDEKEKKKKKKKKEKKEEGKKEEGEAEEEASQREALVHCYASQFRMLKAGVPEGAVLNGLMDEGLGEEEAQEVLAALVLAKGAPG